jgi:dGTPase
VDREIRPLPADWEDRRVEREWTKSEEDTPRNQRAPQQRDRDRILYCSAFQRLSQVTQVTAPEAGYSFHNRLGHSLKVAQVGRRHIERLQQRVDDGEIDGAAADLVKGTDADAVEASCLAHDLGHPPFGHIAESKLHELAKEMLPDGYEGNAQSFRIVTRLAVRNEKQGLDLTRETLDYLLKYPWRHWTTDPLPAGKRENKWGYYKDDKEAFDFARGLCPDEGKDQLPEKSLGAEIMDWADDLTYAVHDVDDFFRAGLVPLDRLRAPDDAEIKTFTARLTELKEEDAAKFPHYEVKELVDKVREILSLYGPGERYSHTASSRAALREFGSKLITRYLNAFSVENGPRNGEIRLTIAEDAVRDVTALKMLVVVYVIRRPNLAVVQKGQQKMIEELYETYFDASAPGRAGNRNLFPPGVRERLEGTEEEAGPRIRVVLDLLSGLTETAAIELHHRLCGWGSGHALDATALMG